MGVTNEMEGQPLGHDMINENQSKSVLLRGTHTMGCKERNHFTRKSYFERFYSFIQCKEHLKFLPLNKTMHESSNDVLLDCP
jgi:hypothetical protein